MQNINMLKHKNILLEDREDLVVVFILMMHLFPKVIFLPVQEYFANTVITLFTNGGTH